MKLENSLREMDGSLRKMIDTKYNKLLGILTFVLSLGAFILSIVGVMQCQKVQMKSGLMSYIMDCMKEVSPFLSIKIQTMTMN